jgi:hypothetical protein
MDYAAVGLAISRFGKRLDKDNKPRRQLEKLEAHLLKVEI